MFNEGFYRQKHIQENWKRQLDDSFILRKKKNKNIEILKEFKAPLSRFIRNIEFTIEYSEKRFDFYTS